MKSMLNCREFRFHLQLDMLICLLRRMMLRKVQAWIRMLVEVVSRTTLMMQFDRIRCDCASLCSGQNNCRDAVTKREKKRERERKRENEFISFFVQ